MSDNQSTDLFFDVQQKTDKQHILDNPDTYIGSVEKIDSDLWIINEIGDKIIEKNINYIPGLFKLFDEGIVNCRDHVIRMKTKVDINLENALPVTHIDINIEEDGSITMINDGNGIDVVQKDGIWVPELVFGHLRTSTNYEKLKNDENSKEFNKYFFKYSPIKNKDKNADKDNAARYANAPTYQKNKRTNRFKNKKGFKKTKKYGKKKGLFRTIFKI